PPVSQQANRQTDQLPHTKYLHLHQLVLPAPTSSARCSTPHYTVAHCLSHARNPLHITAYSTFLLIAPWIDVEVSRALWLEGPTANFCLCLGRGGGKVLLPPINFIFKLLQSRATISVWLYENLGLRIEGKLRGFDEFMNLVIDDAVEVTLAKKDAPEERRKVGQILLKGDNISLIQQLS
ncbi:hypothetical protein IAQ61_002186, partial [Plenodomus lingam]|uniref:uncharacterized protein n=1 Tax=Leptosphaeria maculans TaxID=5022 RepID=UPI00331FFDEA